MRELKPHDHIVFTEFDDTEGILVDLNTKKYYQLNETAVIIWKGLKKGLGTDEIAGEIIASYEIAFNDARRNVEIIIKELDAYKLIGAKQR